LDEALGIREKDWRIKRYFVEDHTWIYVTRDTKRGRKMIFFRAWKGVCAIVLRKQRPHGIKSLKFDKRIVMRFDSGAVIGDLATSHG
jgi:hypothetical protein